MTVVVTVAVTLLMVMVMVMVMVTVVIVTDRPGAQLRRTCVERVRRHDPAADHKALECALEVTVVGVLTRTGSIPVRNLLDQAGTEIVPVEHARIGERVGHAEYAALPGCLKYRFAVDHGRRKRVEEFTAHRTATPIMASRVTWSASVASSMPSLSAGGSGSTR